MKRFVNVMTLVALVAPCVTLAADLSKEEQIAQAVSPLPESLRAGATVVTYDSKGEPVILREGTNSIVCTPDQHGETFAVSCYHKAMRAQRDMSAKLRAEGKDAKAVTAAVNAARDAGKFPAPTAGMMMYNRSGKTEAEARVLWVMLMPNATAEATGLPTENPKNGGPWMMNAGKPGAHVMMPQASPSK